MGIPCTRLSRGHHVRWFVVLATSAALAGCGDNDPSKLPTVPAGGTLNYNGKPVAKGTVLFQPEKGRSASGLIENGKFTLSTYNDGDGAIVGWHQVAIISIEEVPTKDGDTTSKYIVPQKFADPGSSGLKVEVPAGGKTDIIINF